MKKIHENWTDFEQAIEKILGYIDTHNLKFDYIYGPPRGGLCIAVRLSHKLNVPLQYNPPIPCEYNYLVVDDISDTGKTLHRYSNYRNCTIITWHCYDKKTKTIPDYYVRSVNTWVVYPWEK
jgi:hypoxanthine phosphoribosyltransferase